MCCDEEVEERPIAPLGTLWVYELRHHRPSVVFEDDVKVAIMLFVDLLDDRLDLIDGKLRLSTSRIVKSAAGL